MIYLKNTIDYLIKNSNIYVIQSKISMFAIFVSINYEMTVSILS